MAAKPLRALRQSLGAAPSRLGQPPIVRKPETRTTIVAENVPLSATREDILRMIMKCNAQNIVGVSINYERFRPTGEATIRVRRPQDLYPALYALKNASISHYFLHFKPTHDIVPIRPRTRGAKGRQEAIQRGLITGDGPDAGIAERGKSVVIWGLPPRVRLDKLREFLNNGRLSSEPTLAVVDPPPDGYSSTSRVLVQTKSISDAHRLVRDFHRTFYTPETFGEAYEIRAQVVY
ncbi:hypothetical protein SISNIDRAFT_480819 [Sistotremastrum niveocremeum HHB9708]|uniref:RRM domain-containing protein n=2 Tax=Sistotremastraceae TaxID=3402574 RepID=A0A165AM59_9AGAM|nr:hypothetical protein SISNIDRAFT_480819 [Sistotremastrum niveocremeum HHB9708]KZT42084.1 hypothetical protein SISSUDRAFT_1058949 [Sistotremastrum suecicum HHB10207 ss-3]